VEFRAERVGAKCIRQRGRAAQAEPRTRSSVMRSSSSANKLHLELAQQTEIGGGAQKTASTRHSEGTPRYDLVSTLETPRRREHSTNRHWRSSTGSKLAEDRRPRPLPLIHTPASGRRWRICETSQKKPPRDIPPPTAPSFRRASLSCPSPTQTTNPRIKKANDPRSIPWTCHTQYKLAPQHPCSEPLQQRPPASRPPRRRSITASSWARRLAADSRAKFDKHPLRGAAIDAERLQPRGRKGKAGFRSLLAQRSRAACRAKSPVSLEGS